MFFVIVFVVYLHLFSVVCKNKNLNTPVDFCLHSPHHPHNAFCLRQVGEARHVGDGMVFPMFILIRNNRVGV